jgi:hypothetical protein
MFWISLPENGKGEIYHTRWFWTGSVQVNTFESFESTGYCSTLSHDAESNLPKLDTRVLMDDCG